MVTGRINTKRITMVDAVMTFFHGSARIVSKR
jgi:hypothetical protein